MSLTPVLADEEYVEQAYFFRSLRERIADGRTAQEILDHLRNELLSTTRLPFAVDFLLAELKHSGGIASALVRLSHYFTPFQAFVIAQAEDETARMSFERALLILEREAAYRSASPSRQGLFVYELEAISRNRLGYSPGLRAMASDGYFDGDWRDFIADVRRQLGNRDFAELVFARSDYYVALRRRRDPEYAPKRPVLFGEKEGKIALANKAKDPMYLFATLQRQLGYPEVPRPSADEDRERRFQELAQKVKLLEARVNLLQADVSGQLDVTQFYVKPPGGPGGSPTFPPERPESSLD